MYIYIYIYICKHANGYQAHPSEARRAKPLADGADCPEGAIEAQKVDLSEVAVIPNTNYYTINTTYS